VPRAANADEIALLKSLQHQANELIDEYNRLGETIKTQHALIEEYKKTLEACKTSLTQLNNAVKDGKRAETLAFAMNVLNLRKAYIAVREAK
jgi:phage regulator Rha-like protein